MERMLDLSKVPMRYHEAASVAVPDRMSMRNTNQCQICMGVKCRCSFPSVETWLPTWVVERLCLMMASGELLGIETVEFGVEVKSNYLLENGTKSNATSMTILGI